MSVRGLEVEAAFAEARPCMNAQQCKKVAEAMVVFYKASNEITRETGEGLITFYSPPEGPCPNQGELLCQDRIAEDCA